MNELLEKQEAKEYFEQQLKDATIEAKMQKKRTHIMLDLDARRQSLDDIIAKHKKLLKSNTNVIDLVKVYRLMYYSIDTTTIFQNQLSSLRTVQSVMRKVYNGKGCSPRFSYIRNLVNDLRTAGYEPLTIFSSLDRNCFNYGSLKQLLDNRDKFLTTQDLNFLTKEPTSTKATSTTKVMKNSSRYRTTNDQVKRFYIQLFENINNGRESLYELLPYKKTTIDNYIHHIRKMQQGDFVTLNSHELLKETFLQYKQGMMESPKKEIEASPKEDIEVSNKDNENKVITSNTDVYVLMNNNQIISTAIDKSYIIGYQKAYNECNKCEAKLYKLTEL